MCFSSLNSVLHSIYLQFSMRSHQTRSFRINMFEPVSAFWVSDADTSHPPSHLDSSSSQSLPTPWLPFMLHFLVSPLASTVAHPLDVTHSYCFLSVHCHHLRSGTTVSFLANCSIFSMFSLPSVFPSWFCSKWIRQALGSDCLSLYPDLGPLSVTGNHSTSFMVLWREKEHIIHVKASQHLLNWVEPKLGLTDSCRFIYH